MSSYSGVQRIRDKLVFPWPSVTELTTGALSVNSNYSSEA